MLSHRNLRGHPKLLHKRRRKSSSKWPSKRSQKSRHKGVRKRQKMTNPKNGKARNGQLSAPRAAQRTIGPCRRTAKRTVGRQESLGPRLRLKKDSVPVVSGSRTTARPTNAADGVGTNSRMNMFGQTASTTTTRASMTAVPSMLAFAVTRRLSSSPAVPPCLPTLKPSPNRIEPSSHHHHQRKL